MILGIPDGVRERMLGHKLGVRGATRGFWRGSCVSPMEIRQSAHAHGVNIHVCCCVHAAGLPGWSQRATVSTGDLTMS